MNVELSNWIPVQREEYVLSVKEKKEIFRRGAVISIKHGYIFEPVLSVIQKCEGECIYFRIPEEFLKNNVFKGDVVSCQVMQGEYEYIVSGIISEFEITYPWLVEVAIKRVSKVKNNRGAKRYLVNFQSRFYPKGSDNGIYAIIKNISLTGVGAVFREEVQPHSLVNVFVSASVDKVQSLEFKAKINRIVNREIYNEYGLEIVEIDEVNKDKLDKLIYRLECNEAEFVSNSLK